MTEAEKKEYTLCPWAREAVLRSGQSISIDAEYLSCVRGRCGKWGPVDNRNPPLRYGCTRTER